jgi:glycine/D-amino acid oxidase-like deaminating enzyme
MTDYRQKSWWLQSLPQDIIPNQPLDGSNTADVTIIGGGYTGLSTAYHLKTLCPQLDVCLLESDICGILNPAKLARGLKQVAEKTGAVIFEQSPVTGFYRKKDKTFVVTSPSGRIHSRYLVFATNAYSVLFDKLRALQRPAFTHIVMTEPLTDAQMQSIGWQCRCGIEDARDLIHYYRLTKDNRIVTQTFSSAC